MVVLAQVAIGTVPLETQGSQVERRNAEKVPSLNVRMICIFFHMLNDRSKSYTIGDGYNE
jgi:hypothetical protein